MSATPAAIVHRALAERADTAPATELLSRYAADRDPEAFAGLVHQFGPLVLGVCRRVLGPSPDAEDAFQSVFLALARQARAFRNARGLPAWLHRVALRTARKALARRPPNPPAGAGASAPEPAHPADPFAEVAWKDVRRVLDEELDALPTRCRAAVVLCWLDGLTRDEAAARLGVSPTTLKRRLGAGRELLRVRLARRGLAPVLAAAAVVGPSGLRADVPPALVRGVAAAARGVKAAAALPPRVLSIAAVAAALACGVALVAAERTRPEPAPAPRSALTPDRPAAGAELPLPPGAVARFGSAHFRVEDRIHAAALSPDGKCVAVAGGASVSVYQAATWRRLQTLPLDASRGVWVHGHTLAFSPDGRRLAYTKNGRDAFAWDLKTGRRTHRFDSGDDWGWQAFCAFTPDGLLALSDQNELRFFDPVTGAEKRSVGAPNVAALSPDGKYLVRYTARREPMALVLGDAATGKDLHTFDAVVGWDPGVSFTPDGKRFTLVPLDGTEVQLWDADERALVTRFKAPAGTRPGNRNGYGAGLTPDGSEVWLQLPDNDLARWEAKTFRELPRLAAGGNGGTHAPLPLADGRTVLVPCSLGWVRVFDRGSGAERPIPGRYGYSAAFALSPDGEFVAAGDASGRIDLLDPATGERVRTLREAGASVGRLTFGPDGAVLGVGEGVVGADGGRRRVAARAFWVATGKEFWARAAEDDKDARWLEPLGFTAEDRVVVAHHPNDVRAWNARTGKELYTIAAASSQAAVGPAGRFLATEDHSEIVVHDLANGRAVRRVEIDPEERAKRQRRGFERLAWAADGRSLAAALPEDRVCVLDPVAGRERARFAVYAGEVEDFFKTSWLDGAHSIQALALSPDGKRLLASALNGTYVALWDVRGGKQLARVEPGFQVDGAAFGPDGTSAFTFGRTGLGYRWDVEKLIAARKR